MKISDRELRAMDDAGKSQRGDLAHELLTLRPEFDAALKRMEEERRG